MSEIRVFVSYRRSDTRHVAGRIGDHLRWEREVKAVFFDTASIRPGDVFPQRIATGVQRATHTLVVIGPQWNGGTPPGRELPRLFDEEDFVRREVALALQGDGELIPVLVDGTPMPQPQDVPAELQPLLLRNAYTVHADRNFKDDLRPLITHVIGHEPRGGDTALSIAAKALAGALLGLVAFLACSAFVQYGLGLDVEAIFGSDDPLAARRRWQLLPWAFGLAGALALPLWRRRWTLQSRR